MQSQTRKSNIGLLKKIATTENSPEKLRTNKRTSTFHSPCSKLHPLIHQSTNIIKTRQTQKKFIHQKTKSILPITLTEPCIPGSIFALTKNTSSSQRRMESLENLLNRCYTVQNDLQNAAVLKKGKKISEGFDELKKTVQEIQDFNESGENPVLGTDKWIDKEALKLDRLKNFKPKLRGQFQNKWNHKICIVSRSTNKLVASVATNINKRNGFL